MHYEGSKLYKLSGHTATLAGDTVLMFGVKHSDQNGLEQTVSRELYCFDPHLLEVRVVPTHWAGRPVARTYHTADLYAKRNMLVVTGGRPTNLSIRQQLYLLDLSTRHWRTPETKGRAPPVLIKHSSTLVDSKLFVYGGNLTDSQFYSADLWMLTWEKVEIQGFGRRVGSALVHVGHDRLIVFGGLSKARNEHDVTIIERVSAESRSFHTLREEGEEVDYTFSGEEPVGRALARFVYTQNKVLLIAGDANDRCDYYELLPM